MLGPTVTGTGVKLSGDEPVAVVYALLRTESAFVVDALSVEM